MRIKLFSWYVCMDPGMRFVSAKSFKHYHTPDLSKSCVKWESLQYSNRFVFILVLVFSLISWGKTKFYAVMLRVTVQVCGSLALLFALSLSVCRPISPKSERVSKTINGQTLDRDLITPPSAEKSKLNPYKTSEDGKEEEKVKKWHHGVMWVGTRESTLQLKW